MRALGIVRKVDELGRIVLPVEMRRILGMDSGESVEMYVHEGNMVIKRYERGCTECGTMDNLKQGKTFLICKTCVTKLR